MNDPDFAITVNGEDVTAYCQEWELTDDEQGQSEINVKLGNPDLRFCGKFDIGQDLEIRFGYSGSMSARAYLPVTQIKENFPKGADLSVTVVGRDESQKMSGSKKKGVQGEDKLDGEMLKQLAEETVGGAEGEGTSSGRKHKKAYVMNENPRQSAFKFGRGVKPASGGKGGAKSPKSPYKSGKDNKGLLFSGAGRVPEEGEKRDENRAGNCSNDAKSEPIKAKLTLRGYPQLKAKGNVTMMGVGPAASGDYYVKCAKHSWKLGAGYLSVADLVRGGSGKGGTGGAKPNVMYADIWKRGQMYIGPRKSDGQSQGTFTYGEDDHVIDFDYENHPQPNQHGGEGAEGEGLDLRDKGEAYKEAAKSAIAEAGGE